MDQSEQALELIQQTLAIGSDGGAGRFADKAQFANEMAQEKSFWAELMPFAEHPLASASAVAVAAIQHISVCRAAQPGQLGSRAEVDMLGRIESY